MFPAAAEEQVQGHALERDLSRRVAAGAAGRGGSGDRRGGGGLQ